MYLFTNSVRAMGTFGNGNYVGFFFLVSQIIVLEFYKKEKRKGYLMFWLLLSAGIISTGSRTALLFSLFYFFLIANTPTIKRLLKVSKPLYVGYLLMIVIVGAIVIVYRYEILSFVSSVANRESSVDKSTFALRYEVWQNFSLDTNDFSILLFGNRITGERTTLDNLFLYSLFRYGIIGTIIQLFVYTTALYHEGKVTRNTSLSRNCMMILYLSGFIADYWFNPFFGSLYLFLIGYAFHISNDKRKRNMGVDRLTNIRTSMSMIE